VRWALCENSLAGSAGDGKMVEWMAPALGVLEKVPGIASYAFRRRVNHELAQLVFWQDGMRVALARIARGQGTQTDLDEIGLRLRTTQDKTDGAAKYLGARRERIAATWGAAIAQQIDMIVYRKMGPGQIREALRALVASRTPAPAEAQHALDDIDQFSNLITKLDSKP